MKFCKHPGRWNRIISTLLFSGIVSLTSAASVRGEGFTSEGGEISVSDLEGWKVTLNQRAKKDSRVLVRFSSADPQKDNTVRIELFDVEPFDVFDAEIVDEFRQAFQRDDVGIVTIKPVKLGGRRYQGFFCVRLDTSGEKPVVVYVQQLILVDGKRFHNITIASIQDEPETNPDIISLLKQLKIK